jgi:hypothetical protein
MARSLSRRSRPVSSSMLGSRVSLNDTTGASVIDIWSPNLVPQTATVTW